MAKSLAERFVGLPKGARDAWLASQPSNVLEEIARGEWWWLARPEQVPPLGDWLIHLALAGRGFGKSRAGSEWLVEQCLRHPTDRWGTPTEWLVIAETLSDSRLICMEGPAGILRVLNRKGIKYRYVKSPKPMVIFEEYGTKIFCEGADNEDVGRGYNAAGGWCIAEGELVLTNRGQIPVEDVRAGDQVWTRSGWERVNRAGLTKRNASILRIETEAGCVRVTANHLILTQRGWVRADEVDPTDCMFSCSQKMDQSHPTTAAESTPGDITPTPVLRVMAEGRPSDVYDLSIEGTPEFFCGSGVLLVHNCDEIAKWPKPRESWYSGIMPSLRADLAGDHPRVFVTTTPKPSDLLREWVQRKDGTISIVRGSTFDNASNLSALVVQELKIRYEGTAIGRQELYGELMDAFEGALFSRLDMENHRVLEAPDDLVSIVVGVDPALTGEDDEMGVIVVGRSRNNHHYVLADCSKLLVGRAAARHCWHTMLEWGGDVLLYESNLGKQWMKEVLADAYAEMIKEGFFPERSTPPMKAVDSKHGKKTRAEPVAMRLEQGKLHMVGRHKELEDQMAEFIPDSGQDSPDRMDALVHACRHFMGAEKKTMRISSPADIAALQIPSDFVERYGFQHS